MTKLEYKLAKANGMLEKIRREKIERAIAKKYTAGQEFRIHAEKDTNPEAWQEHEIFVETVKEKVDAEILAASQM